MGNSAAVRRVRRMVLIALTTIVLAYAGIAAALYFAQGSLLYPAPRVIAAKTGGFDEVSYSTADGVVLRAGYRPAQPNMPTLVFFHGNGSDWPSSVVAIDQMVSAGYGVLAAEYRGYRGNSGSPDETGLYADGRAALAWLEEQGVAPQDVVFVGNSIGSGVAVQMASEMEPRALILISPFASLSQLVGEKFRWLPTNMLLRDRYDNIAKLPSVRSPVLILHGDADTLIPYAHARQLAAARPGAQLEIFPGYGHDLAWHDIAQQTMLEFLEEIRGGSEQP